MAKNYRRAARGGRFKRQDFGDLGLRAYKEQQDTIIESLKLQQARSKEYAGDYASGLSNVARSEEQNRNLLQDLENDLYKSKVRAIEKNQAREVEALKAKADQYGKQAQFWKELAPGLSKNLGELAQGTTDLVGLRQAMKYMEENDDVVTDSEQVTDKLSNILNKDINKKVGSLIEQGNLHEASKMNKIPLLARKWVGRNWLKSIEDNWNLIQDQIKEAAGDEYNKDPRENTKAFILLLAKEQGLNANHTDVRKAITFAQTKAGVDVLNNNLNNDYLEREDIYNGHLTNFKAIWKDPTKSDEEKKEAFISLKDSAKLRLHKDKNNKITRPSGPTIKNEKIYGVLPTLKGLIETDSITTPDELDDFLDNENYVEKKYQSGAAWEEDLQEIKDLMIARQEERDKAGDDKIKQDDSSKVLQLNKGYFNEEKRDYEEWNWNDFSPDGHRAKAYQLLHSLSEGHTKSKKWLAEKLSYNTSKSRDWNAVNQELQRYAHQGNFLGFMSIYNNLTTAQKEGNTHLYDTLAELNAANIQSFDDLSNISKAKISGENAQYKLPGTRGLNASETLAKDAYGQTVLAHFWALESQQEKKGTIKDRWEAAERKADDDWSHKDESTGILGRGLLRRKPPGVAGNDTNQVVYMAYTTEKLEGQATSTKDLFWNYQEAIVPKGQKVYNLDKGTLSPKLSYIIEKNRILTNDELDKVIEAVTLGENVYRKNQVGKSYWTISIPPNANVKELVKLHNERNQQQISQREIYQAILVKHGINLKIPENAVDLARAYLKTPNPDIGGERAIALGREDDIKFKSESEILIRSQYKWYLDNKEKEGTFDWSKLRRPEINQFLMEYSNGN